jgi:hypothetical protein
LENDGSLAELSLKAFRIIFAIKANQHILSDQNI